VQSGFLANHHASGFDRMPEHGTELVLPELQRTRFHCRKRFSNATGLERQTTVFLLFGVSKARDATARFFRSFSGDSVLSVVRLQSQRTVCFLANHWSRRSMSGYQDFATVISPNRQKPQTQRSFLHFDYKQIEALLADIPQQVRLVLWHQHHQAFRNSDMLLW